MRGRLACPLLLLLGCGGSTAPRSPGPARPPSAAVEALVVRGGTLYTMDPAHPRAELAVVEQGRFACVGTLAACGPKVPPGARVVDLRGGSAVPGLADAHGHVVALGLALEAVSLRSAASEEECVSRLAARAKSMPPGGWVVARGWDQTRWPGQAMPTEAALSRAVPDRPALAIRVDGHAVWVNARALELAGVTASTRDPPGGRLERDAGGRPTGLLVDNAQSLVWRVVPPASRDAIRRAILAAQDELLAVGLTSVHDAGVTAEALDVYRELATQGRLKIHIYAMINGSQPPEVLAQQMALWKKTPAIGRLRVGAVKLYADGALGSRGALLFEPYADDPSTSGLAVTPPDELRTRILQIARAGYQPAVHAIGDRACAETLADFVAASKQAPGLRPRVEHLQLLRARDVPLLVEAQAVASMQPTHATSDGPWAEARLGHGTERQKGAYAWRQVLDAHVPLACGSDFPVEDIDPRAGLFSAETRRWPGAPAQGWMPEQKMTREEALRCFTSGPAYAEYEEDVRGRIAEGYEADLTAFAGDVMAVAADALPTLPVTWALVGGEVARSP